MLPFALNEITAKKIAARTRLPDGIGETLENRLRPPNIFLMKH